MSVNMIIMFLVITVLTTLVIAKKEINEKTDENIHLRREVSFKHSKIELLEIKLKEHEKDYNALQKEIARNAEEFYKKTMDLYEEKRKLQHENKELKSQIRDNDEMVKKFNDCIASLSEKNKEIIDLKYKVRELKFELNKVNKNEKTEI